jgi:hypothetical protein
MKSKLANSGTNLNAKWKQIGKVVDACVSRARLPERLPHLKAHVTAYDV